MARLKWLGAVALAGAVAAATAGCGAGPASGDGKVDLVYRLWDSTEQVGYQKSIDEFEKQHPNIHVTVQQVGWTDYWTKLVAEFSAGNPPDVFWNHASYFPQFAKQGVMLDLSKNIQQDKVDTSGFYGELVKNYQYEDGQYGMPKDWDTVALVCNRTALDKAGVTAPGNLSWAPGAQGSLLPFLRKLTVDKSGHTAGQPGFDPHNVGQYGILAFDLAQEGWGPWAAGNGGSLMDKPFGTFTFDSPKAVDGIAEYVDLATKHHVSPDGTETQNANVVQFLASGRVACVTAGDWQLAGLAKQAQFPVTVLPAPAGPAGSVSAFNGLADSISAGSKHPQEAWELVKWLASPESQRILGSGGYVWPALKSEDHTFLEYWKAKGVDVQPYLDAANGKTFSFPLTPGWNAASQVITNVFDQMFTGQVPAGPGVRQAVQQANQAATQAG